MMKSMGNNDHPQGSIWLARVYFKEILKYKARPVIIVNNDILSIDLDVIIVPITSSVARNKFDVILEYWREAGLEKPSISRTSKITSISKKFLTRKLGNVKPEDLERIITMCKSLF